MIGQGSPRASRALVASFARRAASWICRLALVMQLGFATAAVADESTMRLRIAWGGGAARQWHGTIRLSNGTFSNPVPLGIEADEPGSVWLDEDRVQVRQRSARAYDGIDVEVTAVLDARLTIELSVADAADAVKPVEISLGDLVSESYTSALDENRNRLLVMRSPGDRLRVSFERPSLVFSPGEAFEFKVQPQLLGLPSGTPLAIKAQLLTSPDGERVWSQDRAARTTEAGQPSESVKFEMTLPTDEGVYDITIAAINSRLSERLPWKKPLAERKVQLVIVDPDKPGRSGIDMTGMARVLEIDPTTPRWWDRLANIPLIPGLRKGPLGNGDAARWQHPKLGELIQLGPGGHGAGISWEAYPLPIDHPGEAHLLEIEYPSDVPQTMGLSIIEPNAAGAVMPVGLDSGVYVADEEAENLPRLARHRMLFWPRTKTPLLLVTNRREGSRATYGKIRVFGPPHPQFPSFGLARSESQSVPPVSRPGPPERLLAGYFNRPLFPENFSAPESLDAMSRRSLDDWRTFYLGGKRLVDYLNYFGYNGVMVAVLADGSTIYPSEHLEPTPHYDTGVFFATGQDPVRKDALELLYRIFDRQNMQLIPALHFNAPLPELEALRRQGAPASVGIECIGPEGLPWHERHGAKQGLAPYYNPLDPRVQQAMLNVVTELAERYGAHRSFAGIAVELSADGYAQLPGAEWALDDETIARFERDSNIKVPGQGPTRFATRARFLTGQGSTAWLVWRAAALADFHRRIQEQVAQANGNAKLYLSCATMVDNASIRRSLRPALPQRMRAEAALLNVGFQPDRYYDQPGIVLLRPKRLGPVNSLAGQAVDLEMNQAPDVDRLFAPVHHPGSLFYHDPQKARLASFDAKSPFGAANTYTWLVAQLSPSADRNRRRFVHSMATLDPQAMFDGGWLLTLGQEESLAELKRVYSALPAARFETLAGDTQPVTIRTFVRDNETFVYLVNDSAWNVTVSLRVDLPTDCHLEKLGASRGIGPIVRSAEGASWSIAMKPYDLLAAKFTSARVSFDQPRVSLPSSVSLALQRRIQDLSARAAALANPMPLHVLENSGFEQAAEGTIPGWMIGEVPETTAELDSNQPHAGVHSLKLSSTGPRAFLRSNAFELPATGRLSVALWLRVAKDQPQPALRLAVEGMLEGKEFYRYAQVGGATPAGVPLTSEWSPYLFQVDDLPSDGLTDLHVRFDLMGAGQAWIDDVQLFDLAFNPDERLELTKIITLANFKLQARQVSDCARLLEGYWPQFLVANVPLTETPGPVVQPLPAEPAIADAPATTATKKPGVIDKVKGFVPKFR